MTIGVPQQWLRGKRTKQFCLNHSFAPTKSVNITKSCGWNVKNEEVLQYETQFTKNRKNMYVFNYICKHTIREESKMSVFMHP